MGLIGLVSVAVHELNLEVNVSGQRLSGRANALDTAAEALGQIHKLVEIN